MKMDELPENVKKLISRAIATKLKIRRNDLIALPEIKAKVDRCLMMVIAIADNQTHKLDDIANDLMGIYSARGDVVSRRAILREVDECYTNFNAEISGIEQMRKMSRMKIDSKTKAIWEFLRSNVPIGSEYEEDLQAADAWILRGERTATIFSFPNTNDEAEFVQQIIEIEASKRKNHNA
jgi:hypothetical protein